MAPVAGLRVLLWFRLLRRAATWHRRAWDDVIADDRRRGDRSPPPPGLRDAADLDRQRRDGEPGACPKAARYTKLYLDAGPAPGHDNVDCPFIFTEGPLITFDTPGPDDGAPFVRTTLVKLSHFLFHTHRRSLTWHAHGTWHPHVVSSDDSATNVMDWTVTLHPTH